jgi:hypothetical protein
MKIKSIQNWYHYTGLSSGYFVTQMRTYTDHTYTASDSWRQSTHTANQTSYIRCKVHSPSSASNIHSQMHLRRIKKKSLTLRHLVLFSKTGYWCAKFYFRINILFTVHILFLSVVMAVMNYLTVSKLVCLVTFVNQVGFSVVSYNLSLLSESKKFHWRTVNETPRAEIMSNLDCFQGRRPQFVITKSTKMIIITPE